MGYKTNISWCDSTWNPVTGCTPISEGCEHCYGAAYARRGLGDWSVKARKFCDIWEHPERLSQPYEWKIPRRIFVCSMGDLFHDNVTTGRIVDVLTTMQYESHHTYFVLTKRPERMRQIVKRIATMPPAWPPTNVWFGVTAENQARADERIPILLDTPAAHRFVSIEPLLGDIRLDWIKEPSHVIDALRGYRAEVNSLEPKTEHPKLDYVIVGGEKGANARPCDIEWVRNIRDFKVNVPFHFKGYGRHIPPGQEQGKIDGVEYREVVAL